MKIAVIGATGKAGRLIAAEARGREHAVTVIVRPESVPKVSKGYNVIENG